MGGELEPGSVGFLFCHQQVADFAGEAGFAEPIRKAARIRLPVVWLVRLIPALISRAWGVCLDETPTSGASDQGGDWQPPSIPGGEGTWGEGSRIANSS